MLTLADPRITCCRRFKVVSEMDQFAAVKARLTEASIHIDEEDSGLAMVPLAHIEASNASISFVLSPNSFLRVFRFSLLSRKP